MKMSDEQYTIIHLGNPYDFVIKNINEHETYGTFQGDNESMEEFIEKVNSIIKENDELKQENKQLQFRIIDMLDFIKENDGVTRQEMKEWWNNKLEFYYKFIK